MEIDASSSEADMTTRHGQPIRSTKRARRSSGFVDSNTILVNESDGGDSLSDEGVPVAKRTQTRYPDGESGIDDMDDEETERRRGKKNKKQPPRAASTPPPDLSPPISPLILQKPLQLIFNVPAGHQGPFHVHIDLASLLQSAAPNHITNAAKSSPSKNEGNSKVIVPGESLVFPKAKSTSGLRQEKVGFNSLPPEIRNRIYYDVLIGPPIEFRGGKNFCRSANFLRTCKRVYEEGSSVLYGGNTFVFQRALGIRGDFWENSETAWRAIGWKDILRFLLMISPRNIAQIRTIHIDFEDAVPSQMPGSTIEERRFQNDGHLKDVLKLLSEHGQLENFKMGFYGRRNVNVGDKHFLDSLKKIKADNVGFGHAPYPMATMAPSALDYIRARENWPGKISAHLLLTLQKAVLRRTTADAEVEKVVREGGLPEDEYARTQLLYLQI